MHRPSAFARAEVPASAVSAPASRGGFSWASSETDGRFGQPSFQQAHAELIALGPCPAAVRSHIDALPPEFRARLLSLPSEVLLALAVEVEGLEFSRDPAEHSPDSAEPWWLTEEERDEFLAEQASADDDEMDLIRADLDSDAEDYARADEEGWFHADEDDEGLYAEDADGDDADEYGEDDEDEYGEDEEDDYGDVDDDFGDDDF